MQCSAQVALSGVAPKRLGRLAVSAQEGGAHPVGVVEAGQAGDFHQGVATSFNPDACGFDTELFDRLGGRPAGLLEKEPGDVGLGSYSERSSCSRLLESTGPPLMPDKDRS